jgi:hypothetical protein
MFMSEKDTMAIRFDRVAEDKSFLPVTRLLAIDIIKNPYLVVGDFMKDISDQDIELLLDIADDEDNCHFEELVLIPEMLAAAEGIPNEYADEKEMIATARARVAIFITYLTIESLARKDLIIIHRENMSFGDDAGDRVVAEKLK